MKMKPTYEELEQRIKVLEEESIDRKQAEEALRESEERFRRLFEQSNDAIIIHESGRIIDVNQRACEMLGYTKAQLMTMSIEDFHPEDDLPESDERIDFEQKGESIVFKTDFMKSDGSLIPVEVSSNIIDVNKEIIQGIIRDITDRKKAEQRLREAEGRYREIFANIPGVAYQFKRHRDGSYSSPFMSERARDILNISAEEITSNADLLFDMVAEEHLPKVKEAISESARQMATWSQEFRLKTGNGKKKWIRATSTPRPLPNGEILWDGVLFDISPPRESEEESKSA